MSQPGGMFNDPSSNPPVTGEGNKVPFPWWFQNWETIPSQDGNLGPKTAVTSSLDLALGPQDDPASSQDMERVCVCVYTFWKTSPLLSRDIAKRPRDKGRGGSKGTGPGTELAPP